MFSQSDSAKRALLGSRDAVLSHSLGKNKESQTVLTTREFCSRLMRIRQRLQRQAA